MNTNRLIKYLKNDLSELTEIFSELEPGISLSSLEIKMILNRINSVNEEFDMLQNELTSTPKSLTQTKEQETNKEELPKNQNKITTTPPTPEENTIDIIEPKETLQAKKEEVPEPIQEPEPDEHFEEDTSEIQVPLISEQEPEQNKEEPVEIVNEEVKYEESNNETIEESEVKADTKPQQTIADKYVGSSNSLNEQIANLIEQKDLASKLQQNPIEDLTKAIKLNDKIWYSNELFEGNLDLYRETIRTINKMEELDEALEFLESNFQFDQEKKSFKSFIEIIYRRFLK